MRSAVGTVIVLAFTFTTLFVPSTHASMCVTDGDLAASSGCCETAGTAMLVAPGVGTFYLDRRAASDSGVAWIYKESNGVSGLQRGGLDLARDHQTSTPTASLGGHTVPVPSGTPAGVGATSLAGKEAFSSGGAGVALYTYGSAPGVGVDASGVHVSGSDVPRARLIAAPRYDGCYDGYTSVSPPDVNLL